MAQSKSEVLNEFIKSKVRDAINQHIADVVRQTPTDAQTLERFKSGIAASVAYDIANNAYGRLELEDIMRWKIRRSHWN